VALTATVRRTAWSPFWWIVLGLLVSLLARYLWKVRRARLTAEVPIARLAERLGRVRARNAPLDPQETRLLDSVAAALGTVDAEARSGDANVAARQLEVMVVRVAAAEGWVVLRRRVLAGPEQLRPAYVARLERLASGIEADADEDKAVADQLTSDLKKINSDYDTAASAAIKQAIAEFRATLDRFGLADAGVTETLTAADAAVETSPEVAADQLAQAQAAAVEKLTGRLQAELAAGPDPSLDLTADEWDTAVAPVREALAKVATAPDAASKLASYQEADAALLHVLAAALMRRLRQRIATLEQVEQPTIPMLEELGKHQQTLADVVKADGQAATDPAAARQAIEDAVTRFNDALPTPAVLDATSGEQGMAAPIGASLRPVGFIPAGPGVTPEKIPTVADLRRQLRNIEILATIVAFVLAVPIGISFLYANNYTWGSAADALGAFAWGLGAQQVSGQSFTGLFALRDQVFGAS
jgi:hypothetical protein